MSRCDNCGKEIRFINRPGKKALVVNVNPIYFVPDLSGDKYFIHDGVFKRGRQVPDGLQGYTLHDCEDKK